MDPIKKKIADSVDKDELIKLCVDLAKLRSFSMEEKEASLFLADWMRKRGFEVSYQDVEENRINVIGKLPGTDPVKGKSMTFNGHLDVDPVTENFGMDPWDIRVEGNKIWGHGLRNMKAGVASMTVAAHALKKSGVKLRGDIYVTAVVGELQGGVGTKYLTDKKFPLTDYAIVPEPSYLKIRTAVAGVIDLLIHVTGSSEWFGVMHMRKHVNAVEKAAKVITALKDLKFNYQPRPDLPHLPQHLVGPILGGLTKEYKIWRFGYVPDYCTFGLEVRTPPGLKTEDVLKDINHFLDKMKREDPHLSVEVEQAPATYRAPWKGVKHSFPSAELDPKSEIAQTIAKNHREIFNLEPYIGTEVPGSYAGNDMSHLIAAGVKAITYGCTDQVKPPDHYVEIDKVFGHSKVVALATYDLCS